MQNNQADIKGLSHQKALKDKKVFTPSEAKARGIPWRIPPPPNTTCEFCGAILEPDGIYCMGMIAMWRPEYLPVRCTCEKAQKYWADHDREEMLKAEKKEEEKRRHEYIDRMKKLTADSGLKKRFLHRTFKNFECRTEEQRKCYEKAEDYANNFQMYKEQGTGLYFEGTYGTGKTHLAAAIAIRLMSKGTPIILKTFDDILSDIKRAYDNSSINEYDVKDVYKNVDLLIIDDLGKERCTEWSMSILYSIMNYRYENMLPVIITTNYDTDSLVKAMTPDNSDEKKIMSIISRLKQVSKVITMAWEDMRSEM